MNGTPDMNFPSKASEPVHRVTTSALSLGGGILILGLQALSGFFPLLGTIIGGGLIALGAYTSTGSANNIYDKKGGAYSLLTGGLLIARIFPVIGPLAGMALLGTGLALSITGGIKLLKTLRHSRRHTQQKRK